MSVKESLKKRIKDHIHGVGETVDIDPSEYDVIVRAPVSGGAPDSQDARDYVEVNDLTRPEDLPFIPERMRDFSYRYATEYKPYKYWQKEYGVSGVTIAKWLRHPGVRGYIQTIRYQQRMYNFAQRLKLQRQVYSTINDVLRTKITADTIGPIVSMSKFVYQVLHDPENASAVQKGALNVNIGFSRDPATPDNPYRQERDVSPKELEELKSEIRELEIMERGFGRNGDGESS